MAATYEQRSDAHFVGSRLGDDEVIPRGAGQMVAPQSRRWRDYPPPKAGYPSALLARQRRVTHQLFWPAKGG
ncbi:MAG TPA: hypothetical protein PKM59_05250, partial [Thermodesulfobacteriota bacterium]|nr:hypothetical protein [Thermodesulfobacteriota bacterium]